MSSSPTRSTTATPMYVGMTSHPYVETTTVVAPVPLSSSSSPNILTTATPTPGVATAAAAATVTSPLLGREVRYRPSLTYTPVLASTRLVDRTRPRTSISEQDMEELNLKLQQLCLSDKEDEARDDDSYDEEEEELQDIAAAATVAMVAAVIPEEEEGKEDEEEGDDDDLVETNENDPSVANVVHPTGTTPRLVRPTATRAVNRRPQAATATTTTTTTTAAAAALQQDDDFLGRVPMTVLDPRTLQVTSVLRSSRLVAVPLLPAAASTSVQQAPPTLLGRVPQQVTDPRTNRIVVGLRSSRLAKK